jgi:hypothetical protein
MRQFVGYRLNFPADPSPPPPTSPQVLDSATAARSTPELTSLPLTMMKTIAVFLSVAASALAFVPVDRSSSASSFALNAIAPEKEVGVLPPVAFFEYVDSRSPLDSETAQPLGEGGPIFCLFEQEPKDSHSQ